MLFFLNIFRAFYLQENQSKKYVKIQPNSPATLVLDKNKATDFVPFKMTTNLSEFALKSKKSETYFDKIDDFGNLGGTKIIPESDYFSLLLDLNLTNQLKKGDEYVYYDLGNDLFKLGPFNEEVHKGFEIIPRKSDKKHIELLKERAKELESLKNKYESKELDSKPKEEKLTPTGFVSTE